MEELATRYNKSPNENIPSLIKLQIILCKRISKLDEKNQGEKKVIDAVLSMPEFSKVKSNKKKHIEYHYRLEDSGELIEGDISLTKLKQIISLCLQ